MAISAKSAVVAVCVGGVLLTGLFALISEARRQLDLAQAERDSKQNLLHQADLEPLYQQINRQSFGGSLPSEIHVFWANLQSDGYCDHCVGRTDYPDGKPRIRIDAERINSQWSLRSVMQHEMCPVAVIEAGMAKDQDAHGQAFQDCMKRFN